MLRSGIVMVYTLLHAPLVQAVNIFVVYADC